MDEIWLAAPSPALWLARDVVTGEWRVNAAARAWADARGLSGDDSWPLLVTELRVALTRASRGVLASVGLDWQAVELPEAWLVWFTPATQARPAAPWRSATQKLALVQDMVAIGVFERDLRTQEARWDPQMFRLFGIDPLEGAPRFDRALLAVHPDDRERFADEHLRFLNEGGRHSLRYRVIHPDGSLHDLRSLVDVRRSDGGSPLVMTGVIIDESEGAGLVRAQQAATAHLERALRLARVSVWRIDLATQIAQFNEIGYETLGMAPNPHGVPIDIVRSVAHPDDAPRLARAAELAVARNEVVDLEARYRNADGSYRPLLTRRVAERDEHGHAIALLGITLEQSAGRAEHERVRALTRRMQVVADAADLGIWSVDGETGEVEWNAQMYRIYGVPHDGLPASLTDWRDAYVHPDDREALTDARRLSVRERINAFETEFRIVRPDGSVRWVTSRSRREVHDGHLVLIGIHLDTTELTEQRQRAEQALQEKEMALRASQAKSDFLSRASHELRTPLNAVLGFAQLLEHEGPGASPALQMERVGYIRSAGEHLLALVDDVLDLAAIEAGSLGVAMASVPIDEVLVEVGQWLQSFAQRARIGLDVQPCGGWVRADARRLRQIVANLVTNAVKFNRAGGQVWLSAQHMVEAGTPVWRISVRDDGPGLSRDDQLQVFDAFQRLGAERDGIEGVGLGLTIVRQLTELMNGRIEVISAPGGGSNFVVVLEAADAIAAPAPVVKPGSVTIDRAASAPADAVVLDVVYIEDNPVNATLVEGLVALRPGVRLRCAVDGLTGVAMAIASPPDVVLIDMQLPDIDGFEVRRRLRAEPSMRHSRMVALSANGLPDDIARAMAAGFDDYWTKPIDFALFLRRLDALIAAAQAVA